jgi:hypothetical protein
MTNSRLTDPEVLETRFLEPMTVAVLAEMNTEGLFVIRSSGGREPLDKRTI